MNEIKRIIKEYKEVISDPCISDYAKIQAKLHAFDDILEEVEMTNKARCANCDLYFKAMTKEEQKHDMFNKDNTNFNGDCLCKTCTFGAPVFLGPDRHKATETYLCVLETKEHKKVGVCKDYNEFRKENR